MQRHLGPSGYYKCPVCGTWIPNNYNSCLECGTDSELWSMLADIQPYREHNWAITKLTTKTVENHNSSLSTNKVENTGVFVDESTKPGTRDLAH